MRIANYIQDSIVDGPGFRFTLFVQGCSHMCPGCHNPQTHDPAGGRECTEQEVIDALLSNPLTDGITLSGGEPFCQAKALATLGRQIKALGLDIITYTGYTFEELYARRTEDGIGELLEVTDFLVDGRFIEAEKSFQLRFRGSRNQRVIDCKKSLADGCAAVTEFA